MSISLKSLKAIGVATEISDRWIAELQAEHRHYHTLSHISHIIQEYDALGLRQPEMYAAAWLHDIRYDPQRGDNEEVSAEIAREDLRGTSLDIPLVVDIIIDTKHHAGGSPLRDLFNDLDLLIFGTMTATYDHYMRAIRREYAFVPLDVYATKRAEILRGFDAKQVFRTNHFSGREKTAHRNLQREIELLERDPNLIEVIPK
jgi:predicted metal-dependent HD superfamily phosphohydrolase